jgi:5-methylcytosine-specific restriction endonuclease McrA
MNYHKHYKLLISRAVDRNLDGYKERHHIIPKCLGDNNSSENLVYLTAEEHFVAHQLLVKIYPENKRLVYALSALCMSKNGIRNNKMYGWIKKKNSEARKGYKQTKESNNNRRKKLQGRKTSSGMLGNNHSSESKIKISTAQTGLIKKNSRAIYAWLLSPENEKILFGPLLHECRKFNLTLEYVSALCKGKKNKYRGWTFIRMADETEREYKEEILRNQGLMK